MSKLSNKSVRWVVKWSVRGEFEDQARTGRPAVFTKEARRVVKKATYKRGSSTRKMLQQIQGKGLSGSRATVWRYMNKKGWKPFRRHKKPLLTQKQPRDRLKFTKQYKHLTAQEREDFLFSEECPKYLFQLPNPKNAVVWGSQESLTYRI